MAAGDECVYRQAPVDVVVLVSVISALESRSFTHHMTTSSVAVTYAVCFFTPALLSAMVLSGLAGDTLGSSEIITKLFTQLQGSVCLFLSPSPLFLSLSAHILCRFFNSFFCLCHWQATSTQHEAISSRGRGRGTLLGMATATATALEPCDWHNFHAIDWQLRHFVAHLHTGNPPRVVSISLRHWPGWVTARCGWLPAPLPLYASLCVWVCFFYVLASVIE